MGFRSVLGCPIERHIALAFLGFLIAVAACAIGAWSSPAYADTPHCGTIGADEIWSSAGNPHTVDCLSSVTVAPGVTLTITQGTIVEFASAMNLTIGGTLVALGTSAEPITMTAKTAMPTSGFWQGLYFESGSQVRLDYVTIEYAGAYDFSEPYDVAVEVRSPDVSIWHSTLRQTSGTAVYAATSITLTDSLVSDNGGYPVHIPVGQVGASHVVNNAFSGNGTDAYLVAAGSLAGDHSWPSWLAEYPVHIDWLAVGAGASLALPGGTSLHFGSGEALDVFGSLTALGTSGEPITMTANAAAPTAGFWKGLYFNSGSAGDLDHVTVQYAGSNDFDAPYYTGVEIHSGSVSLSHATIRQCLGTGVHATGDVSLDSSTVTGCTYYGVNAGGSITLTDSVVSDNGYYPLRISAPVISSSVFTGSVLTGNNPNAVEVAGATLVGNHTWPPWLAQYPVHIDGAELGVGTGGALSLPAGISLAFAGAGSFLVDGSLTAFGTASEPITMTANTETPAAGFWKGLYFNGGSAGDLAHVTVEYAGSDDHSAPYYTGVEIDSGDVSLSHATIRECIGTGVYAAGDIGLESSTISGCTYYGVNAGGSITLTDSLVSDNGYYALRLSAASVSASAFTGTVLAGNSPNAVEVAGATLEGSHTWPSWLAQYPVHVDGATLEVGTGGALSLPAGISLGFGDAGEFLVNGALTALGTASEPITMTANAAAPTAGYWKGLYFNSGSAGDLDHVTVEYAGSNDFLDPYYTGVEIHSGNVSLSNATIRHSEGFGLYATTSITLTGCAIIDNTQYPVRIPASVIGDSQITANTFSGNGVDALSVGGGTVTGNHTWPLWMAEYPVHIDWLAVGSGASLALPAGIALHFPGDMAFDVDGTLTALGTVSEPITLTANAATPTPGFWRGLYFNSGSTGDLDYVTIEYAGSDDHSAPYYTGVEIHSGDVSLSHATIRQCLGTGVYATGDVSLDSSTITGCTYYGVNAGGSITLTDSVVSDNGYYPLRISAPVISSSVFTGSVLTGNNPNAVEVAGATLEGSHTWPPWLAQYPVHIDGDELEVDTGGALSLPAGISLGFADAGALLVKGALTALGTSGEPVTMTANAETPTAGFWKGLYFSSGSAGDLDHVTIEYAGSDDHSAPYYTGVEIDSGDVSLSHATIRHCLGTGLYATGDVGLDSSTVTGCTYYGVNAGGSITLTDSLVSDNGYYALRISAESVSASVFTGTVLAGNSPNAVEVAGATLMGSHTWPSWLAQYPVHVDGLTLEVGDGGALSLPAGISLGFGDAGEFLVDGALTALGTASEPITMTANAGTPTAGFWKGLYFNVGSVGALDHVTVEYAGSNDFLDPYYTGVEIHSGDVSLSNATIRHSEGFGVYATTSITLTGCAIIDNSEYPVRIPASVIGDSQITANTFSGNGVDALSVGGGTVTGVHTWPLWMAEYPVHIDWLAVGSGASLALPAGIALHFPGDMAFDVYGALTALGTVSEPITLTANAATPTPGFWRGLYFNSGSEGELDHVTVEYAGSDDGLPLNHTCVEIHNSDVRLAHTTIRHCGGTGVYATGDGNVSLDSSAVTGCTSNGVFTGGSITLTNNLINDSGDYPLRMSAENISASVFAGNTFAGNTPDAIKVDGSTLTGSHAWSPWLASYPIHLDWLKVGSAGALTLPAGIGLHFDEAGAFYIDGALTALGTVSGPITMTANSDAPVPAFWYGLYFTSGSAGNLDHVTVEYAGRDDGNPLNYTGVEIHSSDVSLSHATIRHCGGTGVYATGNGNVILDSSTITGCTRYGVYAGGSITLTNSLISENGDYPLRIAAENISASVFAGNTFTGNTPDAILVPGATLTGSHAWSPWLANYPLHLDWLTVGTAGALTLPAGVRLHFDEGAAFDVDGSLTALGTVSEPVTMTANSDAPVPAFWDGLYFTSGSTGDLEHVTVEYAGSNDGVSLNYTGVEVHSSDVRLSHATIRHCGGTGVYATGNVVLDSSTITGCTRYGVYATESITLTNSIISDNSDYALRIPAASIGSSALAGNTFSGNSPDAILVPGEKLEGTHVWPASLAEYPVHVDWLTVGSGAALTLPAGAALYFSEHKFFKVDGSLQARGTPTMPITMTVNLPLPLAGSWQGLYLQGASSGALEYVTLEYAGDDDFTFAPSQTGIELRSPHVSVSRTTIQHNAGSGIYVSADTVLDDMLIQNNSPEGIRVADNATVLVENSVIRSNSEGAFASGANLTIVNSHIVDNDIFGVHNTSQTRFVMATYNWWGDPSGPYHPTTNPDAQGNEVSDYVIYRPWRKVDTRPLDVGVIKTGLPDPVMVHNNLTYTLVISNTGPDAAPGVVMTESLPASVTYASATPSQGSCSGTAPVVCTWDLITASESVTVTIVVTAEKVGSLANEVTVSTLAPDRHDANNDASETTLVVRNDAYTYTFLPLVLRR